MNQPIWSAFLGALRVLPPGSAGLRQQLALPPNFKVSIPDLSKVHPALFDPILDLLTFYADMLMVDRTGDQAKTGDHIYVKHGTPNSWADGFHVLTGEDSIDFDCTVKEINRADQTATLVVRHVSPEKPQIKLAAEWMRAPVSDTLNNWVEVKKNNDGTYAAAVGKETFEVQIKVSLVDGRILSTRMDNPVEVLERQCTDATLNQSGNPFRYQIRRQIEIY